MFKERAVPNCDKLFHPDEYTLTNADARAYGVPYRHKLTPASHNYATLLSICNPRKENFSMFTRIVEVTTKPGKSNEVANAINEKILPFLRQQPGFLDETVLTSETESNRVLGISFWKTKEDAERYSREQFPKVNEILANLIETTPMVRTFHVHTSTPHKIAAGKAA
jgi:heme-degrading monooxygenase HmoA